MMTRFKGEAVRVMVQIGVILFLLMTLVSIGSATEFTLSVSPASIEVDEGEDAVFTLVTNEPLPSLCVVEVNYHLDDGTAVQGEDYNDGGSGFLSFTFNGENFEVPVATIDESNDEEDENFDLILDGAALIGPFCLGDTISIDPAASTGEAVIRDDDFTLTFTATGSGSVAVGNTVGTPAATAGPGENQVMIDVDTAQEFDIVVDHRMEELFVDGAAQGDPWSDREAGSYVYTFSTSEAETGHSLEAVFHDQLQIVIIDDPDYGEITFPGTSTVNKDGNRVVEVLSGEDISFTITAANPCPLGLDHNSHIHHISGVTVDGSPLPDIQGEGLTSYVYTFTNVTESHTLEAAFTRYIDVAIHGHGRVESPEIVNGGSGVVEESVEVEAHVDHTFSMIPETGYSIQKLMIDGSDYGMAGSYTFTDIDADHSLDIFYAVDDFVLEPVSRFGTIYTDASQTIPAAIQSVDAGSSVTLYVDIDDPDHSVIGLLIDNVSVQMPAIGENVSYTADITLHNVADDYIAVEFAQIATSHRLEALDYDKIDISDIPLDARLRPNPATIMFVLDDSGSMDWEFATDDGLYEGRYYVYSLGDRAYWNNTLSGSQLLEWKSQWSGFNRMFYNPEVEYKPWPTFSGSLLEDCDGDAADNIANACLDNPRSHPWDQTDIGRSNFRLDMNDVFVKVSSLGDDHGDTMASATEVSLNRSYEADLEESGDHDYFKIVLTGSGDLLVRTLRTSQCTDTMVRILDSGGSEFRYGDYGNTNQYVAYPYADDCGWAGYCDLTCGRDQDPYISLTNVPAGTYYIDVRGYGSAFGTYILDLQFTGNSQTFPDPPPPSGRTIINAHYYTYDDVDGDDVFDTDEDLYLVNITNPVEYYRIDHSQGSDDDLIEAGELVSVAAVDLPAGVKVYTSPTNEKGAAAGSSDYEEVYRRERQNFVNWFSYYRKRELTATAAVSTVIADMENVYVGIGTINAVAYNLSDYGIRQPAVPVEVNGETDYKEDLLRTLYRLEITGHGTPLRRALRNVGRYFDDTDYSDGNLGQSPYHQQNQGDECKQSFAIVMTDGYWNGGSPGIGNADGNNGDPYADGYSDTLADVAMLYFENDLSDLDDQVPGNVSHQHLVTYTVAFGVNGTLNPQDYDLIHPPFPDWPDPTSSSSAKIDDLWHAAVNGRGKYLNAANPDQLVDSLLNISADIGRRIGSGASLAVNGDQFYEVIDGDLRIFQSEYHSGSWWGDLKSLKFDMESGELLTNSPVWNAATALDNRVETNGHGDRIMATYNGIQGIPFRWNSGLLTSVQQKQLLPYYLPTLGGEDVINYLRGDRSLEGIMRPRTRVLGDFVHSQGVYRDGVLYIGANDGALHAFLADDVSGGRELFAYVPNLVFANLRNLADPAYGHSFFVDSTPFIRKMRDTVMLVGGLGKGGKGYFGLDITAAANINSETELAGRVLWEYPAPSSVLLPTAGSGDSTVTTLSFQSGAGTGGRDVIMDSDAQFTAANGFEVGKSITIIGANCSTGLYTGTNDGTYEIVAVAADGSFIELEPGSLVAQCGDGEEIIVTASTSDPDMGYSFAGPVIVETNDSSLNTGDDMAGHVVLFGNGYASENGTAVLYILDPRTGDLLKKIDTGAGPLNGLSTPTPVDVDADLRVDYVYAGDLRGNLWKFDLTAESYTDWQVAFCADPDGLNHCVDAESVQPRPLFSTYTNQPITGAPDVTPHIAGTGYMVVFGTGKYLSSADITSQIPQSLYGIWDWAPDELDSGYLGTRIGALESPQLSHFTANSLLRQVIWWEGELTEDLNGDNNLSDQEDGNNNGQTDSVGYYRIASDYEPDWSTQEASIAIEGEMITYRKPVANMGWCFDLPGKLSTSDGEDNDHDTLVDESDERSLGERVTNNAIIRDGNVVLISFGLTGSRCSAGAYSFLNERDVFSGGMVAKPTLDLNRDRRVDDQDATVQMVDTDNDDIPDEEKTLYVTDRLFDSGRLHNPIFGYDPTITGGNDGPEIKYMNDSAGMIQEQHESRETRGTYFWEQIW